MSVLAEDLLLALKTFAHAPVRALLTLLGMVIGVTAVIGVMSLVSGLNAKVEQDFRELGAAGFRVTTVPTSVQRLVEQVARRRPPLVRRDLLAIQERCPSVLAASLSDRQGAERLTTSDGAAFDPVSVVGETADYVRTDGVAVAAGRSFDEAEELEGHRVAVIGADVQDALFSGAGALGRTFRLRGRTFRVIGVLQRRGSGFDGSRQDSLVVVPFSAFQELFGARRMPVLSVAAQTPEQLTQTEDEVRRVLRSDRGLRPEADEDFELSTDDSTLEAFEQFTTLLSFATFALCGLSLLVSGIGILNIMLVSVVERTAEIGVRKALGATRKRILTQFATEAVLLALLGCAVGVLLGHGLSFLARWAGGLPSVVPGWAVWVSVGVSAAVGLGFGIFPAARAAELDPVEAMRA